MHLIGVQVCVSIYTGAGYYIQLINLHYYYIGRGSVVFMSSTGPIFDVINHVALFGAIRWMSYVSASRNSFQHHPPKSPCLSIHYLVCWNGWILSHRRQLIWGAWV